MPQDPHADTDRRSEAAGLKIEMVLPTLEAAGMETVVTRMVENLHRRGHSVGVTCTERGGPLATRLRDGGHRVQVVPTLGLTTNLRAPALEAWLRSVQPDVVHIQSGVWLKAARAARQVGVPRVVHTAHGLSRFERRTDDAAILHFAARLKHQILMRRAARVTDRVVAVSSALHEALIRDVGLPAELVMTIPNGIDTETFFPGPHTGALRQRLGIADDALVIGVVARLTPVKNHALLVDAFALLRERLPDVHLILVGDGALRGEIEQRIVLRGAGHRVHFAGEISDMPAVYRDFDVFALSSLYEGTSMSILEAMATGLCVVATDVGGNADLLGGTGLLAQAGDARALAVMLGLACSPGQRAQRGQAARQRVLDTYSEDSVLTRYEEQVYGTPARL